MTPRYLMALSLGAATLLGGCAVLQASQRPAADVSIVGPEMGLPGRITSKNLTSDAKTGLGSWTDGEILRAIREGVSKDGHALFPLMPYPNYRTMSDEDAYAIVAYLRTLKPVRNP
jgi:hypothetical protein